MPEKLTDSEREWLQVRGELRAHRHELAVVAASEFPESWRVAGTPLLAPPHWIPGEPLPLNAIDLRLDPGGEHQGVTGRNDETGLPYRADGSRYVGYSEAVGALAAPAVFENRPTYRLLQARLNDRPHLVFGRGHYFDGLDTGEACAHEYAAGEHALRDRISDPRDPARRPVNLAISTLTVRHDTANDTAQMWLHWRDPAKVGHAGGLYQVIPVGIFQPSSAAAHNEEPDFSLWRAIVRELAEELLGTSEEYGSEIAAIDYETWPFARALTDGLADGHVRANCLGMGVDPLTFATDLLTTIVIEAPLFDELFGHIVGDNAEGRVLASYTFDAETIAHFARKEPMQAAGAALLELAQAHRAQLLG